MWFGTDGSARCRIVYAFDDDGMEMLKKLGNGGDDPVESFAKDLRDGYAELRKDPAVRRIDARKTVENGHTALEIDLTVAEATQLMTYLKRALRPKDMPEKRGGKGPSQVEFSIEPLSNGHFLFLQRRPDESALDDVMSEVAEKVWKDHTATVRIHAPSIEATNGRIVNRAVEWQTKLARPKDAPLEMRVEVGLVDPRVKYGLVGGAALLLVVAALLAAKRRRVER